MKELIGKKEYKMSSKKLKIGERTNERIIKSQKQGNISLMVFLMISRKLLFEMFLI